MNTIQLPDAIKIRGADGGHSEMFFASDVRKIFDALEARIAELEEEAKHYKERHWSSQRELAALREQEPVKTTLVYSSAIPKFIGETNDIESYSCFIHGDTPPRKTQAEAYADAKEMCGRLYSQPAPVAVPDEIKKVLTELRTYNPKADEYGGEHIIPGWADRIEKALRLNCGSKSDD